MVLDRVCLKWLESLAVRIEVPVKATAVEISIQGTWQTDLIAEEKGE